MIISCTKENLLSGLHAVERASGRNQTLPILSHVAVQAQTGKITLSATDLEIGITTSLPAKVEKDHAWTVPFHTFSGFIASLPNGTVHMKRIGKYIQIKNGSLQGKIQTGPIEDFPIIPTVKRETLFRFSATHLIQAFEDALIATAITETRPELTGVYFHAEGERIFVAATDTFRLVSRVLRHQNQDAFSVILPQRSVQEAVRLFKNQSDLEFVVTENQCAFSSPGLVLTSRLLEGTFPDFQTILPQKAAGVIEVDRSEILRRLEAATFFTSRLHDIKVSAPREKTTLVLYAENPEVGEYAAELLGDHGEGEEQTASFNLRYFLDGVRATHSEKIRLELNGNAKPAVLRPKDENKNEDLYLLMPIHTT